MVCARRFVAALVICTSFTDVECFKLQSKAGLGSLQERTRIMFRQKLHEHKKRMHKLMSSMTLESAVDVVSDGNSSSEIMSLLQKNGVIAKTQTEHHHHHRHSHLRRNQDDDNAKSMSLAARGKPASGYSGVEGAKKLINEMIYEVQSKYEIEMQKCCQYDDTQTGLMEECRQDISMFNAESAQAREEILDAQSVIGICMQKIPELKETLEVHLGKCKSESESIHAMLKTVTADIEVINTVLGMTDCKASASAASLLVYKCHDGCGTYTAFDQQHVIRSASPEVQALALTMLTQKGLQEGQRPRDASSDEDSEQPADFLQMSQDPFAPPFKPTPEPMRTIPRSTPCKVPVPADKRQGKCSISDSPACPKLQEKFLSIQSGIVDKKTDLEEQLQGLVERCEKTKLNLEAQINDFEMRLKGSQTSLAGATKHQNEATEQTRLKSGELKDFNEDYEKMTKECHDNYENFESEECGMKKIRGEVFNKLKGNDDPAFFQDCQVSDWIPAECSQSCGGGTMTMTRTIEAHPVGGAECPPLSLYKKCGEIKCPIDCVVGDWAGWSGCSSKCGGGVMERLRFVKTSPENQGEPCGETSEVESCNAGSCDMDCVLMDWTGWSNCTKECNSGINTRKRFVLEPAVGDGECADIDSEGRLQTKDCNSFMCMKAKEAVTLKCKAKLDVVILIDGSGSLGQDGWDASIKAASALVKAYDGGDALVAVQLFHGPKYWSQYDMCVGDIAGTPDLWSDCGIKWVSHFTDDISGLASKVEALQWPAGTTLTSVALQTASAEFALGRDDAESIVIVITDGYPLSEKKTHAAATKVKEMARLVFVPVTRYAPLAEIKTWASWPWSQNVLQVDDFADLAKMETVDKIVADTCMDIDFSER